MSKEFDADNPEPLLYSLRHTRLAPTSKARNFRGGPRRSPLRSTMAGATCRDARRDVVQVGGTTYAGQQRRHDTQTHSREFPVKTSATYRFGLMLCIVLLGSSTRGQEQPAFLGTWRLNTEVIEKQMKKSGVAARVVEQKVARHQKVYAALPRISSLVSQGEHEAARRLIAELLPLADEMTKQNLQRLQQRIAQPERDVTQGRDK